MNINATRAIECLRKIGLPVVTTRDATVLLGISKSAASHLLRRLEQADLVYRLRRGRWVIVGEDPLNPVAYLTAPYPSYVSSWTALSLHDMIDQIPRDVEVVTTARSTSIVAPTATYRLHHVTDSLFGGFDIGHGPPIASPEKALFDAVYLPAARGMTTVFLPEIELPEGFDPTEVDRWVALIESPKVRAVTSRSLQRVLGLAGGSPYTSVGGPSGRTTSSTDGSG